MELHNKQFAESVDINLEQFHKDSITVEEKDKQQELQILNTTSEKKQQSHYRPDIDGLRTIAVGIVIIFHAWPNFMTGGFIGVDVFFVISGYLISGIIIKKVQKNSFSYKDFYSRRIKRIYPALLLVLVFVLFVSSLKLYADQLQMITKTMAASTIFGANIQIMSYQKGYFDLDVKRNYLLHLWSLGVQEQFYILWPCLLLVSINKFKKKGLFALLIFTLCSFVLEIVFVYQKQQTAFYFPIFRFWQMAVGGLLSYANIKIQNFKIINTLSFTGMGAIIIAIWILNENSLFPGWWVLVPTLSAAAIILAGKQAYFNKFILSSGGFVFIGKISYPMYLWHWPLLVYFRQFYSQKHYPFIGPFSVIILTIILSYITFEFVQKRLRFHKSKVVIILLITSMVAIGILSLIIFLYPVTFSLQQWKLKEMDIIYSQLLKPQKDDLYITVSGKPLPNSSKNKARFPPSVQKLVYSSRNYFHWEQLLLQKKVILPDELKNKGIRFTRGQVLNEGKYNKIMIIGDSHAGFISHRFKYLYQERLIKNDTNNFPTVMMFCQYGHPYWSYRSQFHQTVKYYKPSKILIVNRNAFYMRLGGQFTGQNYNTRLNQLKQDMSMLGESLKQLKGLGIQIYVVNLHPDSSTVDPELMIQTNQLVPQRLNPYKLSQWRQQNKLIVDMFQATIKQTGVSLIDFSQHSCWQDICELFIPSGFSIHFDNNHYTTYYYKYWASTVDFLVQ